ncbi:MAG: Na/Pi cotransporter family protein [Oscillospiraceae bacterium]|nr:Na/Pi cotransporter family protein [Oscillospiraceae bacterium]
MDIFSVLMLIGGLSFFLFGMKVMSKSLERIAGGRLEAMLQTVTNNRWLSLVLGIVITIAMQSSSASTVMLVGLVNSGIMQLGQTISVIFGANIGTTLTAWILSLSGIESDNIWVQMLKPENFSPIVAFIGVILVMFCKNDQKQSIGNVCVGFGVLMYGMTMMSDAVSPVADLPEFAEMLVKFENPLVGLLIGTLFTAVIQSSAATVAILLALSISGGITVGIALPIILGLNIGTCATSLISSIGTNVNARRVAVVHVTIKIIGALLFLVVIFIMKYVFRAALLDQPVSAAGIAMLHSAFNIVITVILMPFDKQLVALVQRMVPDKSGSHALAAEEVLHLDERLLRSPSVAIRECNNATIQMATLARASISYAQQLFDGYSAATEELVRQTEDELDICEDKLGTYLVKLSARGLSQRDSKTISKMLHVISDFECLGDYAVDLQKVAKEMHAKNIRFDRSDMDVLVKALGEILDMTMDCYARDDFDEAARVEPLEQVIDGLVNRIRSKQIDQLQQGSSTIEMGFILSDLLTSYERISDHCSNVAVAVIEVEHGSFDTHKYLNGVKFGSSEFKEIYEAYEEKYRLTGE